MAVKILSEEMIEDVGMVVSGFIVTIKGRYELHKFKNDTYICIAYANYYSNEQAYLGKKVPIIQNKQIVVNLQASNIGGNMFSIIYNHIKASYQSTIDI
jgi:hypothetical protein